MKNDKFNTPPVIRVFLSSTFADMDNERNYFNEVIAPKFSRICTERGVSFFSVDLRWGITKEDQINGKVLPICLSEIDKCRPYFIGIIGNRYGSVVDKIPAHVSQTIPWLKGKEGVSITELEMYYAVLDHTNNSNSSFYIRSDSLTMELYGEQQSDTCCGDLRLNNLKEAIINDSDVSHSYYNSIEEFGDSVMNDLLKWLDDNFPNGEDIALIRQKWYNSEILRNYVENTSMSSFFNAYTVKSNKSLLLYGDGARGKTTHLTAWQPESGHKVLINCASDDLYLYWPSIVREIIIRIKDIDDTCGYPDYRLKATMAIQLLDNLILCKNNVSEDFNRNYYIVTDKELREFRNAFLKWLSSIKPKEKITIVINDLNLLDDIDTQMLSWLPSETSSGINIICSTNNDHMVHNAEMLGWNTKEMPFFDCENAKTMIRNQLYYYGKKLTEQQISEMLDSILIKYPGQLRFIIKFLNIHGRFDHLDQHIEKLSKLNIIDEAYFYVYDFLSKDYSETEMTAIRKVLGLVRCSGISLREQECYSLLSKTNTITAIEWAHICRIFEQFEIINGDYWNIQSKEVKKFIDRLLTKEEISTAHTLLGDHFLGKLYEVKQNKPHLQVIRDDTTYAKEVIRNYQAARNWEKLITSLVDAKILSYLSKLDWKYIRAAWVQIFLHTDYDIPTYLLNIISEYKDAIGDNAIIPFKVANLIVDLGYTKIENEACNLLGVKQISGTVGSNLNETFSKDFFEVYNAMSDLKSRAEFKKLHMYTCKLFSENRSFNDIERCQLFFFKADCEEKLRMDNDGLKTANQYYIFALKCGLAYEIRRALSMRGSILFRIEKNEQAQNIHSRVASMALEDGDLRFYLASKNMIGMCQYRVGLYEESLNIFDSLIDLWKKLDNTVEVGNSLMNRCNALLLSGDARSALNNAQQFYENHKTDESLKIICLNIYGNMGCYAIELKEYDLAEKYLLEAKNSAKNIGHEFVLITSIRALISLYDKIGQPIKGKDSRNELMLLLWERHEYRAVAELFKETVNILLNHNYYEQAVQLKDYWINNFSKITGGKEYLNEQISDIRIDDINIDKLNQQLILAKSEKDVKKEADTYVNFAQVYIKIDYKTAVAYCLKAAPLFAKLNMHDDHLKCISSALVTILSRPFKENKHIFTDISRCTGNRIIKKIIILCKKICEIISDKKPPRHNKQLHSTLIKLLKYTDQYEKLTIVCILTVSNEIIDWCDADELIELVNAAPEHQRNNIVNKFGHSMVNNLDVDTADLKEKFNGPTADLKLAHYEKCVTFLMKFDSIHAAAIAGNIATIYRRRRRKDKTIRYHSISSEFYKRNGNNRDYLIELLHMATAYKEFKDIKMSIEILRHGLKESDCNDLKDLKAYFSGNLAATLMETKDENAIDEIKSCFAVEEEILRQLGNEHELVISLLNQFKLLYSRDERDELEIKLAEAEEIVQRNNFRKFFPFLTMIKNHLDID